MSKRKRKLAETEDESVDPLRLLRFDGNILTPEGLPLLPLDAPPPSWGLPFRETGHPDSPHALGRLLAKLTYRQGYTIAVDVRRFSDGRPPIAERLIVTCDTTDSGFKIPIGSVTHNFMVPPISDTWDEAGWLRFVVDALVIAPYRIPEPVLPSVPVASTDLSSAASCTDVGYSSLVEGA